MKIFLLPAIALLLLPACHRPEKPVKERPVQIDTMQLIAMPAPAAKVASNDVYVACRDSTTYIHFGDCYFSLDWIIPDAQLNDFELCPDTLYFRLAHLHTIEGQMLAITTSEINRIRISQCYETSAVVEHEPLRHWKHYRSPWEIIPPEASNFFICKKYSTAEKRRFPVTTLQALQQHVKQHSSPATYARVARLNSFPAPPVYIGISRYYIRLNGEYKKTTDKINKLLIIDVNFNG